jgi:hypothetical protein
MANTIDVARVQNFSSNITIKYQQKDSRLRPLVGHIKPVVGKLVHFELLDSTAVQKRTARNQPTNLIDATHTRRCASPSFYDGAMTVDPLDLDRVLIDPKSSYAENFSSAMGRAADLEIYTAARGTAREGEDGSSTAALPSGQKVAVGGTGMTLAKILDAATILNLAEVPVENRYFVINAIALKHMLNIQQLTNSDYNSVRLLTTGQMNTFMGFTWVLYNYAIETATYYAIACDRNALGLAEPKSMTTQVDRRPDLSNVWQIYVAADFGAVRIQDEGVVEIAHTA